MKKIIVLLTILAAFNLSLKAQTSSSGKSSGSHSSGSHTPQSQTSSSSKGKGGLKIAWGDLNKNEKHLEPREIFGDMKNGIYMIRTQGDKHTFIAKYTGNLSQSYEKELIIPAPPEAQGGKFGYDGILYLNGKAYLRATFYNKAQETRYLLFYSISPTGEVNNDMKQMDKITDVKNHQGGFDVILSHDSTKILIVHEESFKSNEKERLSFSCYDASLQSLWSKTIELPYLNKEFDLSDYNVDNEGNVIFVGKKELKGAEKTGKAHFDYRMIAYYWKEDNVKEFKFDLGDKIIDNLYFTFDSTNNIMVAGFYSNKNNTIKVDGYYYSLIDRKSESVTQKIVKDLEADFAEKYKFATKKGELAEFRIEDIYPSPNGNLILIAEQNYSVTYCNKYGCYTTYYANDILVFSLKPSGELNWVSDVAKKQIMGIPDFESYIFVHDKDNLYFVYNDNPENALQEKEKLSTYKNTNKSVIMIATVGPDGITSKKESPQPDNDNHLAINMDFGSNIGGGNYTILARYKDYYRLGIAAVK